MCVFQCRPSRQDNSYWLTEDDETLECENISVAATVSASLRCSFVTTVFFNRASDEIYLSSKPVPVIMGAAKYNKKIKLNQATKHNYTITRNAV